MKLDSRYTLLLSSHYFLIMRKIIDIMITVQLSFFFFFRCKKHISYM